MEKKKPSKRRWFSWGSLGRKRKQRKKEEEEEEAVSEVACMEEDTAPLKRKVGNANLVGEWIATMTPQEKKKLRRLVRPDDYDDQGLSPLHRACGLGDVAAVRFLLALGADPHANTRQAPTPPIVFAASNGHSDILKLLLAAGAKVDDTDAWGNTALYKAACYNYVECMYVLLEAGADPEFRNRWDASPLQYAVLQGHVLAVQVLLRHGTNPDSLGEKSEHPVLIAAAVRGYTETLTEILKYRPNLEVTFGEPHATALYMTTQRCLSQHSYWEYSEVASQKRFQCIYHLLSAGARVSLQCMELLYCENFIPYDVSAEYILLVKLLLQAYPYTHKAHGSFRQLFEHAMSLVPHKWSLLQLICSIGFTPSEAQLSALRYKLTDTQTKALSELVHNPRPLMDLCRTEIRHTLRGSNVLCAAKKLPVPETLKGFIAVKTPRDCIL